MRRASRRMTGAVLASAAVAALADAPDAFGSAADRSHVQPVAALIVRPLSAGDAPALPDRRGELFVVDGTIVDRRTGEALIKPRLIVRRGDEATLEAGVGDGVVVTLAVRIDAADDVASTSTEVRDHGVVTGTSSTRFAFARP